VQLVLALPRGVALTEPVSEALGAPLRLPLPLPVPLSEALGDGEPVGEGEARSEGDPDAVPLGEAVAAVEREGEAVGEVVAVAAVEREGETVGEAVAVAAVEREGEAVGEAVGGVEGEPLGDTVPLDERGGEPVPLVDPVPAALGVPLTEPEGEVEPRALPESVAEGVAQVLAEDEPLTDPLPRALPLPLKLVVADPPLGVGEVETLLVEVGVASDEGVALRVPLVVGDAVPECELEGEPDGDKSAEGEQLADGDALAPAERAGEPDGGGEPLIEGDPLALRLPDALDDARAEADGEPPLGEKDPLRLPTALADALPDDVVRSELVALPVVDASGEALGVAEPLSELLDDALPLAEPPVGEGEDVSAAEADEEDVVEGVRAPERETEGEGDGEGELESVDDAEGEPLATTVALALPPLAEGELVPITDPVPVVLGEAVLAAEREGSGEREGVAVAVEAAEPLDAPLGSALALAEPPLVEGELVALQEVESVTLAVREGASEREGEMEGEVVGVREGAGEVVTLPLGTALALAEPPLGEGDRLTTDEAEGVPVGENDGASEREGEDERVPDGDADKAPVPDGETLGAPLALAEPPLAEGERDPVADDDVSELAEREGTLVRVAAAERESVPEGEALGDALPSALCAALALAEPPEGVGEREALGDKVPAVLDEGVVELFADTEGSREGDAVGVSSGLAVAASVARGEGDPLPVSDDEGDALRDAVEETVGEPLAVLAPEGESLRERSAVADWGGVPLTLPLVVALGEGEPPVGLGERVDDALSRAVHEPEDATLAVGAVEAEEAGEGVAGGAREPLALAVLTDEPLTLPLPLAAPLALNVTVGEGEPLAAPLALPVMETVALPLAAAVPLGDNEPVALPVPPGEGDGDPLGEVVRAADVEPLTVPLPSALALGELLTMPLPLAVAVPAEEPEPLGDGVPSALAVALRCALALPLAEPAVALAETVEGAVREGEGVTEGEPLDVFVVGGEGGNEGSGVPLREDVGEPHVVPLTSPVRLIVAVGELVALPPLDERESVPLPLTVAKPAGDALPVPLPLALAATLSVAEQLCERAPVALALSEAVSLSIALAEGELETVSVPRTLRLAVPGAEGESVPRALPETAAKTVTIAEAVALASPDRLIVGKADTVPVAPAESDELGESVSVREPVEEREGEGVSEGGAPGIAEIEGEGEIEDALMIDATYEPRKPIAKLIEEPVVTVDHVVPSVVETTLTTSTTLVALLLLPMAHHVTGVPDVMRRIAAYARAAPAALASGMLRAPRLVKSVQPGSVVCEFEMPLNWTPDDVSSTFVSGSDVAGSTVHSSMINVAELPELRIARLKPVNVIAD
jgi:hypothetical protein